MTEDQEYRRPEPDVSGAEGYVPPGPGAPMTAPGLSPDEAEPPARSRRSRRGRRSRLFWSVFIVLVLAVVVASRWNLNYYALLPGTAQPVQQFITVPPDKGHPVTHPVLLTDVEIGRVTALTYLYYRLQGNSALEQVDAVTGGTPPSQLNAQGALEMSQAENDAKAAALTRLGYSVPATQAGAVIFGTYPGTPAYQALSVGDVVTAVNGVATPTAEALVTNAVPVPLG